MRTPAYRPILTACLALVVGLAVAEPAAAQLLRHPDPVLHYVYPAGGRQGETVAVELGGLDGVIGGKDILIDGAPGITVRDVKATGLQVHANFVIAPDAAPGRRMVRVVGGANGITNFRYFHVGRLPEVIEKEPNDKPESAQLVTLPVVIEGRLQAKLDVDCYGFNLRAGQRIVAAVLGHGMDSRLRAPGGNGGFLDTSLELLDDKHKIIATVEDTLGLDPVLDYTAKAEGKHTLRIKSLNYGSSPAAVYRITLGEAPYPSYVFPAGGQRGQAVDVEFGGFLVPDKARQRVAIPQAGIPWQEIHFDHPATSGRELPFIWGDHPEVVETEPNDNQQQAQLLNLPVTANGRFDQPGDADWYRVTLKKGEAVALEVTAQRHLRSPVDTLLEAFDSTGKKLIENDDGAFYAGQCEHDFASNDSRLEYTAVTDGDHFIRISEQSGVGGKHAIYRLTASRLQPDFRLYQWPDAVAVWGPGTTASFAIQVQRWGPFKSDIQLRIEGLPAGWKGSVNNLNAATYNNGIQKAIMTITAPANATVGQVAPFRVVGRVQEGNQVTEHDAQPLTLYGSSHNDRMHLRFSPRSYAAVAGFLDSWLETPVTELTTTPNGTVKIPVKIHYQPNTKEIGISVDGETPGVATGWRTPVSLKPGQTEIELPLEVGQRVPGTYGIVVSRSWSADLRAGRPGPCTPLILLHIQPAAKK